MKAVLLPEVDALLIARNARKYRSALPGFVPKIGLSIIDYNRISAIDLFYSQSQCHRDFYKDPTGKVLPVTGFDMKMKKFASAPDPTTVYTSHPLRYVRDKRPGDKDINYEQFSMCLGPKNGNK
ncbi:uncharacterized protein LOC119659315 [Hermetia illucens]|uniref:uncharacterized protein LOC119659315 n=1 Tax=Hermetia illucens TaxID=343691 RepID=UPI0018CC4A45|nr:uncharacterized protein LOC119659315 [Hermetia illucens]